MECGVDLPSARQAVLADYGQTPPSQVWLYLFVQIITNLTVDALQEGRGKESLSCLSN